MKDPRRMQEKVLSRPVAVSFDEPEKTLGHDPRIEVTGHEDRSKSDRWDRAI